MQKDYPQIQGQSQFNQNQTVLYASQRPAIPGQQVSMMYATARNMPASQQTLRPINMTQRVQYHQQPFMQQNNFNQVPPSEVMVPSYAQSFPLGQHATFVQNGGQSYYQTPMRYQQTGSMYIPVPSQFNQYGVAPQAHNQQVPNSNQLVFHTSQMGPTPQPQQQYINPQHIAPVQQPHATEPLQQTSQQQNKKKGTAIRLTDPATGKDLTNEVFKHKEKTASSRHGGSFTSNIGDEEKTADVNAQFASMVLKAKTDGKNTVKTDAKNLSSSAPAENKQVQKQVEKTLKPPPPPPPPPEVTTTNENQISLNKTDKTELSDKEIKENDVAKETVQEKQQPAQLDIAEKEDKSETLELTTSIEITPISKLESTNADDVVVTEQPENVEALKQEESQKPVENSKPIETPKPVETLRTAETSKPVDTSKTVETSKPLETSKPVEILDNFTDSLESEKPNDIPEQVKTLEKEEQIEKSIERTNSQPKQDKEYLPEKATVKHEIIEPKEEDSIEAEPKKEVDPETNKEVKTPTTVTPPVTETEPLQDDNVKPSSAFNAVTKKKKPKNRFKDFDSKDKDNNDMLSAYKDTPEKEESVNEVKEVEKKPEPAPEDATWEDKEKSIEKEVIRNEDAEEPEILPKTAETKIIKSEDQNQISTEEDKLQYDRDFLLKFQFAPICTSKPEGLPNIDIVLDQAHAPTKALVPGQRISAPNDFMPTFMRSHSSGGGGGKSSSSDRSRRDRRAPPPGKPQKIIQAPAFHEKIELQRSENAWVRPSEKAKTMSEEEKAMDEVKRNVCSILNKLTPQKFKELVSMMLQLKVNTVEKLEITCDLIFEKAVSEPNFCVAYANMCRVLTDSFKVNVLQPDGKTSQVVTFRKILLNKCQKEFEKENTDEKNLEEDRNKTFETEEELKAWREELDFREMKNRWRMLGNIRFIGELFKFHMISGNIMHDCIVKLLRYDKQGPIEDNLECLCKLLATIGKDLDHKQAKNRMDQYFTQIKKIIEKKKISSRIKFALQDTIELRESDWVPRRDEGNPKTIDQINKEAEQKLKEQELLRQQEKLQKMKEPRGGRGGGRDSPVVRGPGAPQITDGWTNVTKGRTQIPSATVDVNKFKISKKDPTEVSLGPGGRPGVWSRGASGGSSRSGSGSNTPTNELEQRGNRYDVLADTSVTASSFDNKRGRSRGSGPSKRGTPPLGAQRKSDEKSAALRTVQDFMGGRSSRNQSPARSGPPSGTHTPVEGTRSPNNQVTEEKVVKATKSTIEEFLSCRDLKEAALCIKELESPSLHHIFVQEAFTVVIEKKSEHRRLVGSLFHKMMKDGVLTVTQMCKGIEAMVEFAPDFAVDVPLIYKYFGEIIGCVVYDGTLPLNKVKDILEPLVQHNKAGLVMAEALSVAVQKAGKEELVSALWSESSVTWDMLLNNNESVDEFIKDKNMEFTLTRVSSHNSRIQQELIRLLKDKNDNKTVITYVQENVSASNECKPEFVRDLTKIVCRSTIKEDKSSCRCNRKLLKDRKDILERFINSKKQLELHAVYALQQLSTDFNHPFDLLKDLFEVLYDNDVISEETFYIWEKSKDFPDGKGVALSLVKGFLNWLRKAEEESNEEDSSLSTINTSTNAA